MIISDLVSDHAKMHPEKTALIFRDQPLSYGELNNQILKCAQGLSNLGIKKGDTFALVLRNSPEFLILSFALSRIGAISVPLNFLEKAERIALVLNDAKAVGVLTSKEFRNAVKDAAAQIPTMKHLFLRDGEETGFRPFSELLASTPWSGQTPTNENDLMMLLYTSGTTGLPKGVMLTHRNFLVNVDQCLKAIELSPKDKFLCLLPLFHSFCWTTCMLIPLKLGTFTVIVESLLPFDPVIKTIWKYKISTFVAVPQIFSALSSKIQGVKALILRFLNPVRVAISGAAPLPTGVHGTFQKIFGIPLLEGYGLTEASPVVSLNPGKKPKVGTVGLPLPGVEVGLFDEEGKRLPDTEVGEIWVRGDNVMKGYYNKPAESKESITDDGWLKTGDMGRLDSEGYLSIVDRKKDLIIIKGLNVYPQEIENVIFTYPNVREVAVVGKMDPATGEETIRAFVTAKEGVGIDKAAIFALCRAHLAAYKLPKEIILLDEMPKNAVQKILKKELRNRP